MSLGPAGPRVIGPSLPGQEAPGPPERPPLIIARRAIEGLREVPVSEVFAIYGRTATAIPEPSEEYLNESDSESTYTPPPALGGEDGEYEVTIQFPCAEGSTILREDRVDPLLGMPRDLNGDGVIDAEDHADDYRILPVRIRVDWSDSSGARSFAICTTLLEE